ncbi:hypothetical protein BC829DRAFT_445389 [Chytridium lagenaria]|nr:hypothetical protein BC829DRAFT_445389 [Chytridium lagenaria]
MATTILDNTWKPDKPQTISLEEYENVEVNTVDLIKHVRNRKKSKKVRLAVRPRAVSTEPRVEDMTEATRNIYQTGSVDIARRRPLDASSEYKKKERVSGSRKTIFTNIASVSCLSHNAAIVRQNLQGFFSVRVEPSIASILDYEPGSRHKRSIVLKNYSATVQKVTLHPPQTKLFRLAGKSTKNMDSFLIAPGLDTSIEIEFLAPLSTSSPPMVPPNTATPRSNGKRVVGQNVTGTSKMPLTRNYQKLQPLMLDLEDSEVSMGLPLTTKTQHIEPSKQRGLSVFAPPPILSSAITAATQPDPSSRLYEDILGAYPAGPRLKFKREVDFGVVVHGLVGNDMKEKASDKDSQWDRYARPQVAFEVVPQALQAKGVDLGEPIAVDYLEFRNVGKRTARFRILPSNSKTRLKITPDYLTLGIPEGGQGQLGLPDTAMVKVELFYSGVGRFSEEVRVELENPTPVVSERSEIDGPDMDSLDSIGETPLDNTSDIDPKHLNFGESAPMVPSSYRGKLVGNGGSNHGNAGLSDMTNEGILNPYQTSDIVFNFAPRVQDPIVGFKVTRAGSDTARKASLAGNQVGEEPIDIVMTGKACPIEATLSSNQMHFEDVVMGKSSETTKEVVFENDSDQLGYRFRFTTAAHFHTYPSVGHLGPLESINVKVVFKPNQLGHFSTKLQCIISSSDDVPTFESALLGPGKVPLLVKFAGDHKSRDICNLPLSLKGCFRPSGSLESEPFSKFEEVRKIGSNLKHRNSNSGTLLMQADMEEGKIARTIHLEKDCQNLGHRRSLSEGEQKAHEDWLEKTSNRHQYWDYLKQSRVNRLFEKEKDDLETTAFYSIR